LAPDEPVRVAVVTGASAGIGRAIAVAFAELGWTVAIGARRAALTEETAKLVVDAGGTALVHALDVTDSESIDAFCEHVNAEAGTIDVLVNNAGLGHAHRALDVSESDWDEMMSVNLRGVFFICQAVARVMIERGGGRIINMSSQGGLVGLPDAAVYCTSKGGVNMLTKVLALEWAQHGITVNAIAPTFILTPGTAPILDDPERRKQVLDKIPLGQFGETEDVAGAVIYLATSAARLVTGTVLVVDGGWTAQ
jgi:NAD(P)-dependent dehydrogenase (short-subunit alcohol dehydrogenase family)